MQRLVLHVGRHKTGTSAIQHCLTNNRAALRATGVSYPVAGTVDALGKAKVAHHPLAQLLREANVDKALIEAVRRDFREETRGFDTIIVSSEGFQNLVDLAPLRAFFDDFEYYELQIIIYLRESLSYTMSGYQQFVQNQERFLTFDQFHQRNHRITEYVERWRALGPVSFRPFDRSLLLEGDVVRDFLDLTGVGLDAGAPMLVNPSITGNLLFARLLETLSGRRLTSYVTASRLASAHSRLAGGFFIADDRAAALRGAIDYNAIVEGLVGPLHKRSFADCVPVPDPARLAEDFATIYGERKRAEMLNFAHGQLAVAKAWF